MLLEYRLTNLVNFFAVIAQESKEKTLKFGKKKPVKTSLSFFLMDYENNF